MTRSNVSGLTSLVLVLVAFSSLVSMFAVTRIDNLVHGDLYRYNLRFSYEWAMPYWTLTTLVFAMGWFNIFVAIGFQFYVLLSRRKEAEAMPQREALKPEITPRLPIEEKPVEAEKEPAETVKAETEETIAPPMEVELETRGEGEEPQKPTEEPVTVVEERSEEAETLVEEPQEAQGPVEETGPQEYMETEQPEEVEGQKESEAETMVAVEERGEEEAWITETIETEPEEPSTPPMEAEERDEPVEATGEAPPEERIAPTLPEEAQEVEEQREQETATQEREETQTQNWVPAEEHETTSEETQQQEESELAEQHPT